MNLEELKEQTRNAAPPKVADKIENTIKVSDIVLRKVRSLKATKYETHEIAIGLSLVASTLLQECDEEYKEPLRTLCISILSREIDPVEEQG